MSSPATASSTTSAAPSTGTDREESWKKANRLFPRQNVLLLIPAFIIAAIVHWLTYKLGYAPIWLAVVPLFYLWVAEASRGVDVGEWFRLELRTVTAELRGAKYELHKQQLDFWNEVLKWKDHIGYLTDSNVPVVVKEPMGFLVAMRWSDPRPLIYFVDQRTGRLTDTGPVVYVVVGRRPEVWVGHDANNAAAVDGIVKGSVWVYATARSIGEALQLTDKILKEVQPT